MSSLNAWIIAVSHIELTKLQAGMSRVGILLDAKVQTGSEAHPGSCYRGSFFGIKWFRRNGWLHAPISIETKNEWSCSSILPIFLHGSYRCNLTITFEVCRRAMDIGQRSWRYPILFIKKESKTTTLKKNVGHERDWWQASRMLYWHSMLLPFWQL